VADLRRRRLLGLGRRRRGRARGARRELLQGSLRRRRAVHRPRLLLRMLAGAAYGAVGLGDELLLGRGCAGGDARGRGRGLRVSDLDMFGEHPAIPRWSISEGAEFRLIRRVQGRPSQSRGSAHAPERVEQLRREPHFIGAELDIDVQLHRGLACMRSKQDAMAALTQTWKHPPKDSRAGSAHLKILLADKPSGRGVFYGLACPEVAAGRDMMAARRGWHGQSASLRVACARHTPWWVNAR